MADEDFKIRIKGVIDREALKEMEDAIRKAVETAVPAGMKDPMVRMLGRVLKEAATAPSRGFSPTQLRETKPRTTADQKADLAKMKAAYVTGPSGNILQDIAKFTKTYGGEVVKLEGLSSKINAERQRFGEELIPQQIQPYIDAIEKTKGLAKVHRVVSGFSGKEDPLLSASFENATAQKRMWQRLSQGGFDVEGAPEQFGLDIKFKDSVVNVQKEFERLAGIMTMTVDGLDQMTDAMQEKASGKYWKEEATRVQSSMESIGGKSYEEWHKDQEEAARRMFNRGTTPERNAKNQQGFATFDPYYDAATKFFENKRQLKMVAAYKKEMGLDGEAPATPGGGGGLKGFLGGTFQWMRGNQFFKKGGLSQMESLGKGGLDFMEDIKGGLGAGKEAFGKAGGGAKGMAAGAAAAGPMIIVAAIQKMGEMIEKGVEILKKFWEFMVKSSPQLQATIKLTMRGLMLFIRPFGDVIAVTMRPMARWLIRLNREAMKAGRAAGKPGSPEYLAAYMKSWSSGFMSGFWDMLVKPLVATITSVLPQLIETLTPIFVVLAGVVAPIIAIAVIAALGKVVIDFFAWLYNSLVNLGIQAISGIANFFTTFVGALVGMLANMLPAIMNFAVNLATGLVNAIENIGSSLLGIGQTVFDAIMGAIKGGLTALMNFGSWIWQAIKDAISGALKGVANVGGFFSGIGKALGFAEGGIVTGPTHALIGERGPEAVIPLGKAGGLGTTVTLNWNQNAPIYGVSDLEKTVQSALDQYFRTKVTLR